MVFPGLNVARGPIVDQANAEDMVVSLVDGDAGAYGVAGANEYAEL